MQQPRFIGFPKKYKVIFWDLFYGYLARCARVSIMSLDKS